MLPALPRIVLGTATLGVDGSRDTAFRLLDQFVELGGAIIDTAAVYSDWVPGETRRSESIIGAWLRTKSPSLRPFVATKGAHPLLSSMERPRLDRASIRADVEGSLRALGLPQLDLFYLHRDDASRPVEDILTSLRELVDQGKIANVGVSNWTPQRIALARKAAIVPIASNQVFGNILSRHLGPDTDPSIVALDAEALADAASAHSSLFLFSSQAGGRLSKPGDSNSASQYGTPAAVRAAKSVRAIAADAGIDPTNMAVAYLLQHAPYIFAAIGSRTVEQVTHSMRALHLSLSTASVAQLDDISGFKTFAEATPAAGGA